MTDDWVVEASSQQLGADGPVLAAASSEQLQPAAVGNREQLQAASSGKQQAASVLPLDLPGSLCSHGIVRPVMLGVAPA
jgi:hypothetical protein